MKPSIFLRNKFRGWDRFNYELYRKIKAIKMARIRQGVDQLEAEQANTFNRKSLVAA